MDGWIRIGTKLEHKKFDKQIAQLKTELKSLEDSYNKALNPSQGFATNQKTLKNLELRIERTKNKIVDLENASQPKGGINGFDKLYKSAKNLALGILSVRTAYTILSRASSAYLASDTETTNKLQSNWVGLGTILAPAIKFLVDLMRKAVVGVLHFMSVLTGIDFIAKANANALKQQEKATNSLKKANDKLTASFDEMNVLQSTESTSNVNTTDLGNSLFDINELSKGTQNAIAKIAEALKPVYNILKKIVNFALENPEAIIGILGGVGLLSMMGKILGISGMGGSGLLGIYSVLAEILAIGTIVINISYTIQNYKKYKNALEESNKNNKERHKIQKQNIEDLREEARQSNLTADKVNELSGKYKDLFNNNIDLAQSHVDQYEKLNPLERIIADVTGEYDNLIDSTKRNVDEAWLALEAWGELYDQGLLNEEQATEYELALQKMNKALQEEDRYVLNVGSAYKNADEKGKDFQNMQKELKSQLGKTNKITTDFFEKLKIATDREYSIDLTANTEESKRKLNNFFNKFQTTVTDTFTTLGIAVPKFPTIKLAHGGIINNPGRGVPLGNGIIGGEAGREMVMPLDSQTMAQLGQEIGKWITINANIVNQMNGRTISRELKTISAESDFATNR